MTTRLAAWFALLAVASVVRWGLFAPAKPRLSSPVAFPERLGDLPQNRLWLCHTPSCDQWRLGGPDGLRDACPDCGAMMYRWLLAHTGHGPVNLIDERVYVTGRSAVAISLSHWPVPTSLLVWPSELEHLPRLWYTETQRSTDPENGFVHSIYTSAGLFNLDIGSHYPASEWFASNKRVFPRWRDWLWYSCVNRLRGKWVDLPVRVFSAPPVPAHTKETRERLQTYYRLAFRSLTEPVEFDNTLPRQEARDR
jgi:hypothetical protein